MIQPENNSNGIQPVTFQLLSNLSSFARISSGHANNLGKYEQLFWLEIGNQFEKHKLLPGLVN